MSLQHVLDDDARAHILRVDAALTYGALPTPTGLSLVRKWATAAASRTGWTYPGMQEDLSTAARSPIAYYPLADAAHAAMMATYRCRQSGRYSESIRYAADAAAYYLAAASKAAAAAEQGAPLSRVFAAHELLQSAAAYANKALTPQHGPSYAMEQLADARGEAERLGLVGPRTSRRSPDESRADIIRYTMECLDLA